MKTILLFLAAVLTASTINAQAFSENFNSATINSLVQNCWIVNGVSTTELPSEAISARSIYTAPPTNSNAKTDVYTPVCNISVSNPTISFDYRLTQTLSANASRSIQVGLVTTTGSLLYSHTITMGSQTGTNVLNYTNTFSSVTPGDYRVVFRISGNNGSGNVRLVIDNFSVTGAAVNIPSNGNCNFVPISEATLPVKLSSFNAILENAKVKLTWTTATEINVSHFVVERSTDGINYADAGMVFAYGNTTESKNYSISDNIINLQATVIYYRLRSVDIDGKNELSNIRVIRVVKGTETTVSIITYPNPVNNDLRITVPANWQNKRAVYEIFSANGQIAKRVETGSSSQTETINVSNLAPGFYVVKVSCNNETAQQRIVKQ
jgi:hypothetical protein